MIFFNFSNIKSNAIYLSIVMFSSTYIAGYISAYIYLLDYAAICLPVSLSTFLC